LWFVALYAAALVVSASLAYGVRVILALAAVEPV
jgi:hypothetical protein